MTEFDYKEEIEPYDKTDRLGDREVFKYAQERQKALNAIRFPSIDEAREAAHYETIELDQEAYENEVMGEVVTLRGDGIVVPSPRVDSNNGSFRVLNTQLVRTDETLLSPPYITGTFYGFTPLTVPVKGSREHRAIIGHQVALSKVSQPNIYGTLMAYGPVQSTELDFLEDRIATDTQQAIDTLRSVEDEKTAVLINTLDDLMGQDGRFDRQNLHVVGRLIRVHLRRQTEPTSDNLKDMILDLVKSKLGLYSDQPFRLVTDNPVETSSGQSLPVGKAINSTLTILGITFTPHYWWQDGEWQVDSDQDALSLVVLNKGQMVSVPFEQITTLQPAIRRRATA